MLQLQRSIQIEYAFWYLPEDPDPYNINLDLEH